MLGSGQLHTGRALTGLKSPIPKSKHKDITPIEAFYYFSIKAPPYKIKILFSGQYLSPSFTNYIQELYINYLYFDSIDYGFVVKDLKIYRYNFCLLQL